MPSRPLTFEQAALISLEATPYRMLGAEHARDEEVIEELLRQASQWPKRTKRQVELHGPGTPTLRTDLISIALGRTLRKLREHREQDGGDDWRLYGHRARLLRAACERVGGVHEDLVATYERGLNDPGSAPS